MQWMWLRGLHWRYQPEQFAWNVSLISRSEGLWSVWWGWRRGSGEDTLVFERRGMSSSIPRLVLTAGKGIKAGKYKREVSKVGKKNMIAKDSTGGRWLWDPKIRWRNDCVSFFPFLVKDGGVDALAGRRSVCLVGRLSCLIAFVLSVK